jgi:drug/metabolite transporter (DMT)-like permease
MEIALGRKTKMNIAIVYILISVLAGGVGQIILKKGMSSMGPLTLTANDFLPIIWRMFTNPFVVIGLAVYGFSTILWLTALSRVDLSYAYPFASLGYVIMLFASWQLFHENISVLRLIGCGVVILGVILISRT